MIMTKESTVTAMVDLDQDQQAAPTAVNMNSKKKELLSTALKRTSEWSTSFIFLSLFSFSSLKPLYGYVLPMQLY